MSAVRVRRYDRWRDVDGAHVPVGAWVQQTEVDARMGAPRSRLHRKGQVTGRGATRLLVQFDGEHQAVSIRPHLVRVVPADTEISPLTVEHITMQLRDLLSTTGDGS